MSTTWDQLCQHTTSGQQFLKYHQKQFLWLCNFLQMFLMYSTRHNQYHSTPRELLFWTNPYLSRQQKLSLAWRGNNLFYGSWSFQSFWNYYSCSCSNWLMISNWFTASNHRFQPGQYLFLLVSKVIKLTFHFVFLKLCISHVFKQQEAEDSPKLLYNEFSFERLPDVGFSGTHVLYQQLAQRMDTWRHRYFSH